MRLRVIAACVLVTMAIACGDDNPVGPTSSGRRYLLSVSVTEPVGISVDGFALRIVDSEKTLTYQSLNGTYEALVAEGPVTIEVSKEDYHPKTVSIEARGTTNQDIEILPVTPPAPFSGPFWMTLTADATTCGALPSALRTRRYAVDVDQAGAGLEVHLTDSRLKVGMSADGRVHGTALSIDFGWYCYLCDLEGMIAEPLDDTRTLVVSGDLEGAVISSGAAGQLTGTWEVIGPEGSPRCEGVHAARFDRR